MEALSLLRLLYVLPLLSWASVTSSSDHFIRQVTDEEAENSGISDAQNALLNAEAQFASFVSKYGKQYSGPGEHARRFEVFSTNLLRAADHQKLDPTAVHGVTMFSDLTEEKFRRHYLGLRPPSFLKSPIPEAPVLPSDDLPENFDWREKGAVTDVKNQRFFPLFLTAKRREIHGMCGSCWAFSATGALEGANFIKSGKLVSLSEQQLVDCDHECDPSKRRACDHGCRGGLMTNAYEYAMKSGGLESEEEYPYKGKAGSCKFKENKIAARVSNFSAVAIDENQIAANLVWHGPLSVGTNAKFMQTYLRGVSCPYGCFKKRLDHGVLLVGYGAKGYARIRSKEKPYWIIKNSWGKRWGEKGYYLLCRGENVCGVDNMVSTVAAAT